TALRAAADDGQQRLPLAEATCHAGELGGVAERLEVEGGRGDAGVVVPRGQQVVARDVGLVPERDEVSDTQADAPGEVDDDDPHPSGLRGKGETSDRRHGAGEGRVE